MTYGPGRRRRSARSRIAAPSAIAAASQRAAVLLLERDELAVGAQPLRAPRVGEQQERQQPEHLGLVGHQPREQAGEPDRLLADVAAHAAVALGVDEIDDAQDAGEPLRQPVVRRHAERDRRLRDLAARADQAALHRRLAREERASDLRDGQARHAAERQRHPRLWGERGMAAHEDHPQLIVVQRGALEVQVGVVAHGLRQFGGVGVGDARVAQAVQRLAPRGRGEPGARPVRRAAAIPLDRRGHERVLDGVLGERQVAVQAAGDRGEHGGALVAIRPLEGAHCSSSRSIGWISTEPYLAAGVFSAHAIAASRSSTSRM